MVRHAQLQPLGRSKPVVMAAFVLKSSGLWLLRATAVALLFLTGTPAQAETQAAQLGRVILDVDPVGGAVWYFYAAPHGPYAGSPETQTDGLYKVNIDIAGRVASGPRVGTFLGVGLKAGVKSGHAEAEPRFFVLLTLEKLLRIPLVPEVRLSVGGGADIFYRTDHSATGPIIISTTDWSIWFEAGVGFHYFVTRHVGLGAELTLAVGPFILAAPPAFSLYGELIGSARFSF
jgi:hypothetical protein